MKLTIRELKEIIRHETSDLTDDKAFNKESIYVPKDTKKKIKRWLRVMKLGK